MSQPQTAAISAPAHTAFGRGRAQAWTGPAVRMPVEALQATRFDPEAGQLRQIRNADLVAQLAALLDRKTVEQPRGVLHREKWCTLTIDDMCALLSDGLDSAVSRSAVERALRVCVQHGLIEQKHGRDNVLARRIHSRFAETGWVRTPLWWWRSGVSWQTWRCMSLLAHTVHQGTYPVTGVKAGSNKELALLWGVHPDRVAAILAEAEQAGLVMITPGKGRRHRRVWAVWVKGQAPAGYQTTLDHQDGCATVTEMRRSPAARKAPVRAAKNHPRSDVLPTLEVTSETTLEVTSPLYPNLTVVSELSPEPAGLAAFRAARAALGHRPYTAAPPARVMNRAATDAERVKQAQRLRELLARTS